MDDKKKTDVDKLCEQYFNELLKFSPILASQIGFEDRTSDPDLLDDFSIENQLKHQELIQKTLSEANKIQPINKTDALVLEEFQNNLKNEYQLLLDEDYLLQLNNLASPIQEIKFAFEKLHLNPNFNIELAQRLIRMLGNVPNGVEKIIELYSNAIEKNLLAAKRQVEIGIKHSQVLGDEKQSYFVEIGEAIIEKLPDEKDKVNQLVAKARESYNQLAKFLETKYLPLAPLDDAVGIERYQKYAYRFSEKTLDLPKLHQWGISEVERLIGEQNDIARKVLGIDGPRPDYKTQIKQNQEAIKFFDEQAKYKLHSKTELLEYMRSTKDKAMKFLIDNGYFEIPNELRTLECQVTDADGEIHYTPPTEGFKIPGTMWWGIPSGVDEFNSWREKTTVHHEGVPGHHLQCSYPVYLKDQLNDWRRFGLWLSGYGEGWALYAEQLMDEWGFLDDAEKFGMLDGQLLRSARVVIDVGVHCKFDVPPQWEDIYGKGVWNWDKSWALLGDTVAMNEGFKLFELTRYMGWPGQAISYKLGHREFVELRDLALKSGLSLKKYHQKILEFGAIGLDLLPKLIFET